MSGFGNMLKDYLEYHKISQIEFADRLDISQKHMNKILNENADISYDLMLAISLITNIDINLIVFVENKKRIGNYLYEKYKNDQEINKFLNQYYINELNKNNWIKFKDIDNPVQKAMDLLNFLKIKNFETIEKYKKEKIVYKRSSSNTYDEIKILLWLARCDELLTNQKVNIYNSKKFNELINKIKKEQNKKLNINCLIKLLNEYGIYLIVEDALKGTKIRGCMKVKNNNPTIYLTKLYNDKASFYFSLYHELGHVKSDYNIAKNKIIIDDLENINELKKDEFALNTMIDKEI
ncbi:MAG: helix-turn-helix transcriptional regulator [Bacilli bacterium]|nr:helix-turn-helix transcriptional regulator [Bacilli bacterium]